MRLLGFLTGVALLVSLFGVVNETAIFSADKKRQKNDLKSSVETLTAKKTQPKKPVTKPLKQRIDKPVKKLSTRANKSLATGKPRDRKIPKQVRQPALPNERIGVLQSYSTTDTVEPDKPKAKIDRPPPKRPTINLDALKKKTGTQKQLSTLEDRPAENQVQWHSFWGPFNTRDSAQGFANNLAKRTTVKIKVMETNPGAFMVAYPYVSEDERQSMATMIEQRTGLTMKDK